MSRRAEDHPKKLWKSVIALVKRGSPIARAAHALKLPARSAQEAARRFEAGEAQGRFTHWLGGELSSARAMFLIEAGLDGDQSLPLSDMYERGEYDNPPPEPQDLRKQAEERISAMIGDEEDDDE